MYDASKLMLRTTTKDSWRGSGFGLKANPKPNLYPKP